MTCADARPLLDAYFDSELDLVSALNVERHLVECAGCSGTIENLKQLRAELTPTVFDRTAGVDLQKIRSSARKSAGFEVRRKRPMWGNPGVWVAVAAALLVTVFLPGLRRDSGDGFAREVVDSHIRSLVGDHLVDVPSSDQHTVKPWFQGKLDFAPNVPDLADQGFPLVGGRLDVLSTRPAAALVYKRGGHYINLWTAKTGAADSALRFSSVDGYQVAEWSSGGLERWAVTDMNQMDLRTFVELFRAR